MFCSSASMYSIMSAIEWWVAKPVGEFVGLPDKGETMVCRGDLAVGCGSCAGAWLK